MESSFGELFWRVHLESPLKKLLWKLIVFHGFHKSYSQQKPSRLPVDSQWTLSAYSQWTPSRLPADYQQTSTRCQFGELIWKTFLEYPFGEPIEITAVEADSIPINAQQTTSGL
jgi:hypothetical protein